MALPHIASHFLPRRFGDIYSLSFKLINAGRITAPLFWGRGSQGMQSIVYNEHQHL
jgi:hypothetical protein